MSPSVAVVAGDHVDVRARVLAYDWAGIAGHLDAFGWATFPRLLTAAETAAVSISTRTSAGFAVT
jgi:hypothetical protein